MARPSSPMSAPCAAMSAFVTVASLLSGTRRVGGPGRRRGHPRQAGVAGGRCRGPREWRSHTRQQAGSPARSTRRRDSAAPRCSTRISSSEGHLRRGLGLIRVAELASANPARAFGLYPRTGAIAVGRDAALVVLHPNREQIVTPEVLCSAQDFTPFAGMRVRGWPTHTLLRGRTVVQDGAVRGRPQAQNVKRPARLHDAPPSVPALAPRATTAPYRSAPY